MDGLGSKDISRIAIQMSLTKDRNEEKVYKQLSLIHI